MKRTSEYLQQCLDEPRGQDLPQTVAGRTAERSAAWDWIGSLLLHQHLGLHHVLEDSRIVGENYAIAGFIDDAMSQSLIRDVPDMVRRIGQLDHIVTEEDHSEGVRVYFEQAMPATSAVYTLRLS